MKDKVEHEKQWIEVVNFIEKEFVNKVIQQKAVQQWVEWQVVYQIEVFGQEGSQIWCMDFTGEDASIIKAVSYTHLTLPTSDLV